MSLASGTNPSYLALCGSCVSQGGKGALHVDGCNAWKIEAQLQGFPFLPTVCRKDRYREEDQCTSTSQCLQHRSPVLGFHGEVLETASAEKHDRNISQGLMLIEKSLAHRNNARSVGLEKTGLGFTIPPRGNICQAGREALDGNTRFAPMLLSSCTKPSARKSTSRLTPAACKFSVTLGGTSRGTAPISCDFTRYMHIMHIYYYMCFHANSKANYLKNPRDPSHILDGPRFTAAQHALASLLLAEQRPAEAEEALALGIPLATVSDMGALMGVCTHANVLAHLRSFAQ